MARKSTGKRIRFEIFKRDGFRCVYCGATPIQSVLRLDHVIPVAEGGTNGHENLVTACHDCNAGKSSVPIEKKRLEKPMLTEAHRDHAEQIREYLKVQKEIAEARTAAVQELAEYWASHLGPMAQDMFIRLPGLMREWSIEKLIEAIHIVARKFPSTTKTFSSYRAKNHAMYFHGILRRWRERGEGNGEVA